MFTRAGGADVSLRNVTIAQMGNGARECGWRHAPEAREGFWEFWKSQLAELSSASGEDGWLSLARRSQASGLVAGTTHVGRGADGKVIIERLFISLPYVETFDSKVIKGFIPELRSRYVFFVFRDSYVLCIYVMNILCIFHMSMYGYVTNLFLPIYRSSTLACYLSWVLLAGIEEYTDCIFAEGLDPPPPTSILDLTVINLMVRLQ